MQYTAKDIDALIGAVEKEFTAHLAKSEASAPAVEPLAKAEEKPKKEEKDAAPKQEREEPKGDAKEAEPKGEAPAAKEGSDNKQGQSDEGQAAQASAKEGADNKQGQSDKGHEEAPGSKEGADNKQGHSDVDHCDYDDEDRDHMHKMYMSMSKGELKAHHDSCRAALDHKGMEKCGDMSMSKSETAQASIEVKAETVKQEPNKELELLKSEIAAEKAKTEGLQKSLDAVSAFLTKLVEKKIAPQGKAITSLDVVAKSEDVKEEKTFTKVEIDAALSKKAQDPKLEKSDRDAINNFYLNSGSLTSISHLLK